MTRDEALKKAAKLLRLTTSNNPHEAAQAARMAQEILDKFELDATMLEVEGAAEVEPDEPIVDFGGKGAPLHVGGQRLVSWVYRLAATVAKANGCKPYHDGGSVHLIGRPGDVAKVRYLFGWLHHEVERLCDRDGAGCGTAWRNNYRAGVIETIAETLAKSKDAVTTAARAATVGNGAALVKVEQALQRIEQKRQAVEEWAKQNMKLVTCSFGGRYVPGARERGRTAGREIRIGAAGAALSGRKPNA